MQGNAFIEHVLGREEMDRSCETIGPYQGCPARDAGSARWLLRGSFDRAV